MKKMHRILSAALCLVLLVGLLPVSALAAKNVDWSQVAAPEFVSATDNGQGQIEVVIKGVVGDDGADELFVTMYDEQGNALRTRTSINERSEHKILFTPENSGKYTFKAYLQCKGKEDKYAAKDITASFSFPLAAPVIMSATSRGGGKLEVIWTAVHEAEKYEIYTDGQLSGTAAKTNFTVENLTVGQKYTFRVVAVRGSDRAESQTVEAVATQEAQTAWGFTAYGTSTNTEKNGYVGNLNEDGKVTVFSEGGKGKIVPKSTDGLAFYYTQIPTEYNFTLRAKVHVDSWTHSNGQEGFGLMVADRLGPSGDNSAFWNNSIMAVATKIEYRYDAEMDVVTPTGDNKYTMKMGIGTIGRTGINKENLAKFEDNDTDTINQYFLSELYTLDSSAGFAGEEASKEYNIVGNRTNTENLDSIPKNLEQHMVTDFILEIQKNNTGYFVSYFKQDGTLIAMHKYYGADVLNQLDEDYVYAGFFASRNARATFSDVSLTTILASEDAPAEEKPVTKVEPTISVTSGSVTTKADYELYFDSNVAGTLLLQVNGVTLLENQQIQAEQRFTKLLHLDRFGDNTVRYEFMPDPDQDLGPDTVLTSTDKIVQSMTIVYNRGNYHRKTIYVSPEGLPNGAGTQEYPYDIYTAVQNVVPGQTILLMEGTYKMLSSLSIQRSMDGTEEKMIRMMADPAAKTRPVLDFQGLYAGIVHGADWWYFAGFDVTNTAAAQKGFQVSGNHNVLDQIHTYRNGNTGIQISRWGGTDRSIDQWPSYNLILNCTSYLNVDPGEQDADGFACKLTSGVGNVFDGCVAYRNADDGWDLYAKVETGPIGSVIIRNCVAYENGIRENGEEGSGNGNGFKMGGESLTGYHKLENSYAFFNKEKGIDSNSCPDIIVYNSVSYNNGAANVALYTNNAKNTDFEASGILSFKDAASPFKDAMEGDKTSGKGTQDTAKYQGPSNYYWRGTDSINNSSQKLSADMFKSLEFKGILRKTDGTLDMQGFLERNDKTPAGTGVDPASGTPSRDMSTLDTDEAHNFGTDWVKLDTMFHYYECECGDKTDFAPHTYEWITDKEPTATENGKKHEECTVCHYARPAVEIYPEVKPTDPVDPSVPAPSNPAETQAPGAAQPGEDSADGSPVMVIVIVVVVLLVAGIAVGVVLSKKKK